MDTQNCFHCGLDIIKEDEIIFDAKNFCCNGCKTVYEIFSLNDLTCYYDFEKMRLAHLRHLERQVLIKAY